MHEALSTLESIWRSSRGPLVVLTGAGISAASGIPTFRGPEGYWTIGAWEYQPQEIATWAFFNALPEEVWAWYLYRRSVCRAASPNAAHRALVQIEEHLRDRFLLVTQNVDGLHRRAGSSSERTYEIHGNIDRMRCAQECGAARRAVPDDFDTWDRDARLDAAARATLHCSACGSWMRPHVLWFDESYDEERYRVESSMHAVRDAALLLVVGTSGATSLPWAMGRLAVQCGVPVADVNPDGNPFAELAAPHGLVWPQAADVVLPQLVSCFTASNSRREPS